MEVLEYKNSPTLVVFTSVQPRSFHGPNFTHSFRSDQLEAVPSDAPLHVNTLTTPELID